MVYLSTAQQIFEQQYNLGDMFPIIFASLAISVGLATFLNSRYVVKFGMWRIAYFGTIAYCIISILYVILFWSGANPSFEILITFFALQFFTIGFLFGNLRSLAMQPLGHIAGVANSVISSIQTLISVFIGGVIGYLYNESAIPLTVGFFVCTIRADRTLVLFDKLQHTK